MRGNFIEGTFSIGGGGGEGWGFGGDGHRKKLDPWGEAK